MRGGLQQEQDWGSGTRCGEGMFIYLLLYICLTGCTFPPRRECAWRHPQY